MTLFDGMKQFDLICFDVDGTLIEHPSGKIIWELLSLRFGGSARINQARYDRYMAGELSYDKWVELDVSDWIKQGATREQIIEVVREFQPNDGAIETVTALKEKGYPLSVVSGSLNVVIETLFPHHPFDDIFTNHIYFDEEGRLSGWKATPFDIYGKPVAVEALARKYDTSTDRIAYIGDGENDVPLLDTVGYFVAFNPRSEELERRANRVIKNESMTRLLEIF
jgi:HAD superfamily PSPase-like hydrolase